MKPPAPKLQPVPPDVVAVGDYEHAAKQRLDDRTWAYLNGAAGDEITLGANRAAWSDLQLFPRVLRALAGGHTRTTVLGRELAHPILLAPVAFQQLAHPDGELATVHAAAAQGAGMVVSTQASLPLEVLADAVRADPYRGPLWFQLYLQYDRDFNLALVQRAQAAGYEALVVTVDAPSTGVRDRERRTGFKMPPHVHAANLGGLPPRAPMSLAIGQSPLFDGLLRYAPNWADIEWLVAVSPLPVLLKGILHPADALQAVQCGAAGVVVSNHGGRTLDTVVTTAQALPGVAQAVAGQVPVLVDGGIRRGTDVLKALALGADAVLIGRPVVHALATAGAQGVAHVIRLLRDELEIAMALTGCATVADVTPDVLFGSASGRGHQKGMQ
jgi:4-hydroxymandelate oxidase